MTNQNSDALSVRELSATMQVKPEYSGDNHPLRRNQPKCKRARVYPSARSLSAQQQFYELGKAKLPRIRNSYLSEIERITDNPIRKAEPLNAVFADVVANYKPIFKADS